MKKKLQKFASNYELLPAGNAPLHKNLKKFRRLHKHFFIFIIIFIVVLMTFIYQIMKPYLFIKPVSVSQLDSLELDNYDKLMIVAHPDDEYIFGGGHLLEDNYFVVCLTNGNNSVRSSEFEAMLKATDDKGLILRYPDKIANKRSNWIFHKDAIEKDLETLINYKKWDTIVTHNVEGEYGHNQHILAHKLAEKAYNNTGSSSELFFFGTYYKKSLLPGDLPSLDKKTIEAKEELAGIYASQCKVVNKLSHMLPYENFTKAE